VRCSHTSRASLEQLLGLGRSRLQDLGGTQIQSLEYSMAIRLRAERRAGRGYNLDRRVWSSQLAISSFCRSGSTWERWAWLAQLAPASAQSSTGQPPKSLRARFGAGSRGPSRHDRRDHHGRRRITSQVLARMSRSWRSCLPSQFPGAVRSRYTLPARSWPGRSRAREAEIVPSLARGPGGLSRLCARAIPPRTTDRQPNIQSVWGASNPSESVRAIDTVRLTRFPGRCPGRIRGAETAPRS